MKNENFIKIHELSDNLGVSKKTIHNWINRGKLPPRTKLSQNVVGWWESELEEWREAQQVIKEATPEA